MVIKNSENLDITTPHFNENLSYPVDHSGDRSRFHTTSIEPESLYAPQEFKEEIVATIRDSAGEMEEDATAWLACFEEISEVNKWKSSRLTYVKLYLEGTARQWILVTKPATWEEFKVHFSSAFKQTNIKFRLETRLRSRQQELNEAVETYFYDVLNLCRQVEEEMGYEMSEMTKVEHLLSGLTPTLLEKLWPLVPEPICNTKQLLSAATKLFPSQRDGKKRTNQTDKCHHSRSRVTRRI